MVESVHNRPKAVNIIQEAIEEFKTSPILGPSLEMYVYLKLKDEDCLTESAMEQDET